MCITKRASVAVFQIATSHETLDLEVAGAAEPRMTSRNFTWFDRSRVQTPKMDSLSHERNVQILPQDGVVRCFKRMRRSEQPHVLLHHIMDSKDWIPFLWRGWEWRGCLQWLLQRQCKGKCNFTLYGLPLHLLFQLAQNRYPIGFDKKTLQNVGGGWYNSLRNK